ncbi:MAG: hypothetical protein IJT94_15175 [Oscillibacter sp.]|nr:hypothetical protein [Oscillibacter sp.]
MMWYGWADRWYNFLDRLSWTRFGRFFRGIKDWAYSYSFVLDDIPERLGWVRLVAYLLVFCLFFALSILAWLRIIEWIAFFGMIGTVLVFIWDLCRTRYIPAPIDWMSLRPTVNKLHDTLSKLSALEELIVKLETCDPENVKEIVSTEWHSFGEEEKKSLSFMLDGQDDVDEWLDYFCRKQDALLPPIGEMTAEIEEWRRKNIEKHSPPSGKWTAGGRGRKCRRPR